jgi:hypothetical protein
MKKTALPLEPLWEIARTMSDDPTFNQRTFARMVNHSHRAVTRWITADRTIPWISADESAIAIGLHPILIWGDDWLNVKGDWTRLEASVVSELENDLYDQIVVESQETL